MKISIILIILVILLFVNCSTQDKKNTIQNYTCENLIQVEGIKESEFPFSFYLTDSIDKTFVKLTAIDQEPTYLIDWGNEKIKWNGNLAEMTEGQGYSCPPTIRWMTKDYICMMTNSTVSHSQHIFLPLKDKLEFKFFKEDIEYIDSVNLFVIYLEQNYESGKVNWTVESLINNNKDVFEIPIYNNSCCYPWYKSLKRMENEIVIIPQGDTDRVVKVKIKKYCI